MKKTQWFFNVFAGFIKKRQGFSLKVPLDDGFG